MTEKPQARLRPLRAEDIETVASFERDIAALEARAKQIDLEIAEETARIERRFANPQPRLFPVAVIYLVPERLAR